MEERATMKIIPQNQALVLVKEVRHIHVKQLDDLKEVADLLATGRWIAISAAVSDDGNDYLLMLGRIA